ncbi:secreted frizzled-related protein 1 [Lontra canadensis]|nr:secreted frizzled-related protein 1 [Lontra canadensis]
MSAPRRSRELIGCAGRLRGRCYRSTGHSSPAASGVGAARPPASQPAARSGAGAALGPPRALPSPRELPPQAEGRHPPRTGQERAAAEPGSAGDGVFCPRRSLEVCGGTRAGRRPRQPRRRGSECAEPAWAAGAARGGRRWAASGVLLALAAGLLAAGSASEYDYVSFQSDIGSYQSGRFYTKPPQCVDIPVDLRLCHNVGYKKMVLPNLLEHETMAEVKQQASSWVPLLNKNCHIGTQVFLCSLFAPVCLDRPIYPCRWLCEAVRDSCEPVMQFFGFYWPEMLKCDKFPEGDVCIAMTPPNATEASKPQGTTVCPPCDNELKSEAIIEHLCASEFALRMKIKEVKKENGDKKIVPKKKKPLKLGPIKKKELKKLVLYLKNGADCPCHQLDNLSHHFLIMGRKVRSQYLLTAIHKWDKKNKEFKNFMKKMKNHECPTFQSVFK